MTLLIAYIVIAYLFILFKTHVQYTEEGYIRIADIVILILAPFSLINIGSIVIISRFIDVDKKITKK